MPRSSAALDDHDGTVARHAEKVEAEREKERIAGKPDDGGTNLVCSAIRQTVDVMSEHILCNIGVHAGVIRDAA